MSTSRPNGFTIVEVLLVVAIIGMIAVVAVPSLLKARDSANSAVAMVQLRAMQTTEAMIRLQAGRYGTLAEINSFGNNSLGTTVGSTLHHRDFIFVMYPDPTPASLVSEYQILALRIKDGRIVSQYTLAQDGVIRTVIP